MVMPDAVRVWTREDVLALPDDGNRYELIDGALLVSPAPSWLHQYAVARLYDRLHPYVTSQRVGTTVFSPADLDLKSDQFVQPDLFVTPLRPDGRQQMEWSEAGIPILVAEVTSPFTARYDRITKRQRFQRSGVAEYWIVDTDARVIERWTPSDTRPEILDERISWSPVGATSPLTFDIPLYFRDVWGER
jgi:Uma2 family endonuclease